MEKTQKVLLNINDLLSLTGLSRPTLYNLMNSEGFPSIRVGKRILVPTEAFYNWLEKQSAVQKAN